MTKILIAEDNEMSRCMLEALLAGSGYEVVTTANGAEALQKARDDPPALIITDILIPVMDGFALCRQWKADERLRQVPFIFYTATYTDPKDEELALSLGADRFIVKPADPDAFVDIIRDVLAHFAAGGLPTGREPVADDAVQLREYNEVLIRKLEDKLTQLEEANRAMVAEIAERKRIEVQLRQLSCAVEQSTSIVVITDARGIIEYVNPKFTEVTGYTREEVVGTSADNLGEQSPEEKQRMWQILNSGEDWRGEFRNKKRNGEQYWERSCISPIRDEQDAVTHFVKVTEDITERRLAEEQLRQSQKMEAVGHLAGGIAHDFRNQLTVIQGWAYMLQEQLADDEDRRNMVDQILAAAERSTALTGHLLAFSRKETLRPEIVDVAQLVFELSKALKRTIREDIRLQLDSDADLCCADIDAGLFQQAIVNLVVNARDAMPYGGQLILETRLAEFQEADVGRIPESQPGRYVAVHVRDAGVGMDEETRSRVFEPFFTTKAVGKGTGLGLSMVYGFVRQSGGFVECRSQLGEGSQFSLYFPAVTSKPRQGESGAEAAEIPTGRETILVVEDQDSVRRLLAVSLSNLGYAVLEASDGPEALRIADSHEATVDLLVTDVIMPVMSGVELANRLRNTISGLAVLYVSGHAGEELLRRGVDESGAKSLAKPFTSRQLGERVREMLDAR